jgi:hypothetical protein
MDPKDTISMIGAAAALAGLGFGLYQYYIAQKWKRAEFAAQQLERLSADPELDLCCKLLDWAVRASPVPERYAALTDKKTFLHDWHIMREAMLPEEESANANWDWQHMMYRDVFDKFFNYLERINHAITIDLIAEADVTSLRYWLEQIGNPRFLPDKDKALFVRFVERYNYRGVLAMMKRFQVAGAATR